MAYITCLGGQKGGKRPVSLCNSRIRSMDTEKEKKYRDVRFMSHFRVWIPESKQSVHSLEGNRQIEHQSHNSVSDQRILCD